MSKKVTCWSWVFGLIVSFLGIAPQAYSQNAPRLNADCGRLLGSPYLITLSDDYSSLVQALAEAARRPLSVTEQTALSLALKGANLELYTNKSRHPILTRELMTLAFMPKKKKEYLNLVIEEIGLRLRKERLTYFVPHADTAATWTHLGIRAQEVLSEEGLTSEDGFGDMEEALRRMEEDAMIARDEVQAPFVDEFVYLSARQMEALKLAFYLPGPSLLKIPSRNLENDLAEAEVILKKTFSPQQAAALINQLYRPLFESLNQEQWLSWRTLFIPPKATVLQKKPVIPPPQRHPQPPPKENPRWPPMI